MRNVNVSISLLKTMAMHKPFGWFILLKWKREKNKEKPNKCTYIGPCAPILEVCVCARRTGISLRVWNFFLYHSHYVCWSPVNWWWWGKPQWNALPISWFTNVAQNQIVICQFASGYLLWAQCGRSVLRWQTFQQNARTHNTCQRLRRPHNFE